MPRCACSRGGIGRFVGPRSKDTAVSGTRFPGHRQFRHKQCNKKVATIGAATATVTALTVGVDQPPAANAAAVSREVALSAATGPNYTQIITDSSDSLNNILFAAGNFGGAAAGAWDPIASAFPSGLLPTFHAGTTQEDLTSVTELLKALTKVLGTVTSLDLTDVPGLPPNAAKTFLAGLLPGLAVAAPIVLLTTANTTKVLLTVNGVLAGLNKINTSLDALDLPLIEGIPTLDQLIPGLVVTDTTYASGYEWPLLGLSGQTTVDNLFAQLPSLTGSDLATGILDDLDVPDVKLGPVSVSTLVAGVLKPLNGVATPSVTAWVPTGSGNYEFPLGGEVGWLATMPTLDIGPVTTPIRGVGLSDTDTVVAIPIFAGGVALPLNLA